MNKKEIINYLQDTRLVSKEIAELVAKKIDEIKKQKGQHIFSQVKRNKKRKNK